MLETLLADHTLAYLCQLQREKLTGAVDFLNLPAKHFAAALKLVEEVLGNFSVEKQHQQLNCAVASRGMATAAATDDDIAEPLSAKSLNGDGIDNAAAAMAMRALLRDEPTPLGDLIVARASVAIPKRSARQQNSATAAGAVQRSAHGTTEEETDAASAAAAARVSSSSYRKYY